MVEEVFAVVSALEAGDVVADAAEAVDVVAEPVEAKPRTRKYVNAGLLYRYATIYVNRSIY